MDYRIALTAFALLFAGAAAAGPGVEGSAAAPSVQPDSQKPSQTEASAAPADAPPDPTAPAPQPPAATNPTATPPPPASARPDAAEPACSFDPPPHRFLPWLGVQYSTSPQLGDRAGYTSFDAFVPFLQWDSGLFFLNTQGFVNNFDDGGSNIGGGVRWFNRATDRILGGNVYWDTRDTGANSFNQVGMGVESLGRYVDFRANGYIPGGDPSM